MRRQVLPLASLCVGWVSVTIGTGILEGWGIALVGWGFAAIVFAFLSWIWAS